MRMPGEEERMPRVSASVANRYTPDFATARGAMSLTSHAMLQCVGDVICAFVCIQKQSTSMKEIKDDWGG